MDCSYPLPRELTGVGPPIPEKDVDQKNTEDNPESDHSKPRLLLVIIGLLGYVGQINQSSTDSLL